MPSPVVVLFGGESSERLVSVASAQNVSAMLPQAQLWFLSSRGPVHRIPPEDLRTHQRPFEVAFVPRGPPEYPSLEAALDAPEAKGHTFFLALHGGRGENGTVQRLLEARGHAFTGSGSSASALCFDKSKTRDVLAGKGARLAQARVLEPLGTEALTEALHALFETAPRWVLKPNADGSSAGLFHLTTKAEVAKTAQGMAALRTRYLAEEFIAGRELTVGVVDDEAGPVALPVSEVRLVPGGSFDYQGKYLGKGTEEITPAVITEAEAQQAQALAVLAHQALGCFGYTRTDMILTTTGPVFLETNTLPGLTKASFIPQQLAAAQRPFEAFLARQLALGQGRAGG